MSISKVNGQDIIATDVKITDTQITNATFYPAFVDSISGTDGIKVDSTGLTYNSLTNTLTLGASGAGIINANITTTSTSASGAYFVLFSSSDGGASLPRTDAGITYNPSTNILSTTVTLAQNGGGYSIQGTLSSAVANPAASKSYYGGGAFSAALSETQTSRRIYVPKAGTIKACYGFFYQSAASTGLTGTLYIRVNNSSETSVGTAAHNTSSSVYSNTGLSISLAQGDYIEFRWLTPAWTGTLPTNLTCNFIMYVE
jgi:hypothetical protein